MLKDLINTEKVGSFINNIIVEIESEERHDELVKKILRRLKENDLYIKSKKCRWKVREMDFLEVLIGLKEIKIEEVKVKVVLDWLASKMVKDVQNFLGLANYYRRFMKGFAKIARLLHKLTKKKQK